MNVEPIGEGNWPGDLTEQDVKLFMDAVIQVVRRGRAAHRKLYNEYHDTVDRPSDEQWHEGAMLEDALDHLQEVMHDIVARSEDA